MKKKFITGLVIVLVVVLSIFVWFSNRGSNKLQWRVFNVSKTTIIESITATGTINPVSQVEVGTEVSGKIEHIYKDFNDYVSKGELLAKIDTQTLEMNLEEAKIELKKYQLTAQENLIDLNSTQELFDKEMIPRNDLQKAQYTYDLSLENIKKAEFTVQRAQTNLDNAYIYSPINGVIISRAVDEGQTVAASLNAPTLFLIANNLDEMQIEALIDEADIGKLNTGLSTRFTVDAFDNRTFSGKVKQIRLNPISEQNVVTYKVIIAINNPDRILMPGMTANVEIIINQKQDILAIQERALQFRPTKELWDSFGLKWDDSLLSGRRKANNSYGQKIISPGDKNAVDNQQINKGNKTKVVTANIWVLENNMPKQVQIQTGITNGTYIEIVSGLNEGQSVITGVSYLSASAGASSAFSSTDQRRRF
ncbi:MAG: efflux RND transporter periplasmic adaptor subunit [Candidatus Cloacimonetes bacterium]|nr:efflux RND transporter periplasmic adaptor subunit [Candidatus Cloacimonadota bacterium]